MTTEQEKQENDRFFKQVISFSKMYFYPLIGEYYKIEGHKMYPETQKGKRTIQEITTLEFQREHLGDLLD
ncbi:hypothetical protein J1N09_10085 [Aureitalea sp. L0-47]|uniref:hypothetical protein n=1 Tax=Aureitalea sp. L0-47 TaxID=2816962 RepID=UPI002237317F|nr:hypothetical protein [Aureitalea sp. L0-47]MCW5520187.1 hypothetical protein [Aureitalea sp. L0-47]